MPNKLTTPYSLFVFAATLLAALPGSASAQTQILVTNTAADSVLKGRYNPTRYLAGTVIDKIADIAPDMSQRVSPDSQRSYLTKLVSFNNRNTGADTVSNTTGVGAARRWIYSKFQEFSVQSGGRLLPGYLQFDQTICSVARHRDIFAVLPGRDTSNHAVFIVEGHMDSRCENNCNITCKAHGADDNGSGTVLVMELARVLSKYTFNHTIVFLVVIGEEQGLNGANAFATYCNNSAIPVKAVQNNDVVGNILCGLTSSAPSCSPPGSLDSTHVRIFSADTNFSLNKAYARFVKGQYDKWLKPSAAIPMDIRIMSPLDRTGRGGDHEPFSDLGVPAIRFTEANENGNASAASGRQHNSRDVIGEDYNNDGIFDSMFVNWEYLARNTRINAMGLIAAGMSPQTPDLTLALTAQQYVRVTVTVATSPVGTYKVAVRTTGNNDFAVVYTLQDSLTFILPNTIANTTYYVAVTSVDGSGAQSLYSQEKSIRPTANGPTPVLPPRAALKNTPRLSQKISADRLTWIITGGPSRSGTNLSLIIRDARGKAVKSHSFPFVGSAYEVTLSRESLAPGAYEVSLEYPGKVLASQRLMLGSDSR